MHYEGSHKTTVVHALWGITRDHCSACIMADHKRPAVVYALCGISKDHYSALWWIIKNTHTVVHVLR